MSWTHCPKKRQQLGVKTDGVATKNWERDNRQTKKMEGCHKISSWEGIAHSALPARLLVDDTHAYILIRTLKGGGGDHVSAKGVGGNVPLVIVDLG